MTIDPSRLPYRDCVGVVLLNSAGLVWLGKRIPKWEGDASQLWWQMPQGGIDAGETPEEAAFRELREETGTANAELIARCPDWLYYDLPPEALGIALKGKYRGQRQKWFALRYLGSDSDFDISEQPGHEAEFSDWRWAPMAEAVELVVGFKRPVYTQVAEVFADICREP